MPLMTHPPFLISPQVGATYSLQMHYLAYLNDQLHGFYRSSYRDADGTEK